MSLLIPFTLTIVGIKAITRRGGSWRAATSAGMAAVYLAAAVTHFLPGTRGGLIAIVPTWVPAPALVVTLTGIIEILLALGFVHPRTRFWAGIASALYLLAVFPANIVAAAGVDHPDAPTTALIPRLLLQLLFIAASLYSKGREKSMDPNPRRVCCGRLTSSLRG